MDRLILCLNGGSSSLKFAVYRIAGAVEKQVFSGAIEAIGAEGGKIRLKADGKKLSEKSASIADSAAAIQLMFAALQEQGVKNLGAAGHRLVHGGPKFTEPQRIDTKMKTALQELVPFAPLHLPGQIAMIEAVEKHYPDLPQVACFDTAFHSHMPAVAQRLALPQKFWEQGIKRYGFHGLSYEFIVSKMGKEIGSRAVIAHLGNGSSMVALKNGVSIDTTMGLTPTGGFMMGTRSGDLDPGVLLYLMNHGYTADKLENLIDHESGLLGVSGVSSEMRVLLEKRESGAAAALAVEMFCYQVRKFVGAFAAALSGLDTLVFTGGIGERAAMVRAEICAGLQHLGVILDLEANNRNDEFISTKSASCVVRVIETNEDLMIARHTHNIAFPC